MWVVGCVIKGMGSGVLGAVCGVGDVGCGVEWSDGDAVLGKVCRAWSIG